MSVKAALVVLWACLIASAAVASENLRLCSEHAHTELLRSHDDSQLNDNEIHDIEIAMLMVPEVDVTN